jgi:hypothetical protein
LEIILQPKGDGKGGLGDFYSIYGALGLSIWHKSLTTLDPLGLFQAPLQFFAVALFIHGDAKKGKTGTTGMGSGATKSTNTGEPNGTVGGPTSKRNRLVPIRRISTGTANGK